MPSRGFGINIPSSGAILPELQQFAPILRRQQRRGNFREFVDSLSDALDFAAQQKQVGIENQRRQEEFAREEKLRRDQMTATQAESEADRKWRERQAQSAQQFETNLPSEQARLKSEAVGRQKQQYAQQLGQITTLLAKSSSISQTSWGEGVRLWNEAAGIATGLPPELRDEVWPQLEVSQKNLALVKPVPMTGQDVRDRLKAKAISDFIDSVTEYQATNYMNMSQGQMFMMDMVKAMAASDDLPGAIAQFEKAHKGTGAGPDENPIDRIPGPIIDPKTGQPTEGRFDITNPLLEVGKEFSPEDIAKKLDSLYPGISDTLSSGKWETAKWGALLGSFMKEAKRKFGDKKSPDYISDAEIRNVRMAQWSANEANRVLEGRVSGEDTAMTAGNVWERHWPSMGQPYWHAPMVTPEQFMESMSRRFPDWDELLQDPAFVDTVGTIFRSVTGAFGE